LSLCFLDWFLFLSFFVNNFLFCFNNFFLCLCFSLLRFTVCLGLWWLSFFSFFDFLNIFSFVFQFLILNLFLGFLNFIFRFLNFLNWLLRGFSLNFDFWLIFFRILILLFDFNFNFTLLNQALHFNIRFCLSNSLWFLSWKCWLLFDSLLFSLITLKLFCRLFRVSLFNFSWYWRRTGLSFFFNWCF